MKKKRIERIQKVKQREVFKEVAEMKPPNKPTFYLNAKGEKVRRAYPVSDG